jgi:hypothetical protein
MPSQKDCDAAYTASVDVSSSSSSSIMTFDSLEDSNTFCIADGL